VVASPATFQNPQIPTPSEIADHLMTLEFSHWNHQGEIKSGKFIIHELVVYELEALTRLAYEITFPIHMAQPVSYYDFDDKRSCAANNSSAHNMRQMSGSSRLSKHAATAFDLNPMQNPCYELDPETLKLVEVIPPLGQYDKTVAGTLYPDHPLVELMISSGWTWGGNWTFPKDYQHFQKVPPKLAHLFD
jgi:hypothetical protein